MVPDAITTARTLLRPFQPSDVDAVLEYASDPEWSRYVIALPTASYTRDNAERFVAHQASLDRRVAPSWAIVFQNRVVGGVNARFFHEHRVGELGYGLAPRLWGRGLVFEAACAVIGASFQTYPQLVRWQAKTDARNTRSLRVMERLGMTREGLLRSNRFFRGELVDEVIYGLLRSEWRC